MENFIELGICDKAHGIKGGFSFKLYNLEDSSLAPGKSIRLFPKNNQSTLSSSGEDFEIEKIQFGNKVIVYLKGISDRNIVEDIIPFTININEAELVDLGEDEFFLKDLKDFEITVDGSDLPGFVKDFYDNPAHMILVVEHNGESYDIPYVDQFIIEKDIPNKKFTIRLPEMI